MCERAYACARGLKRRNLMYMQQPEMLEFDPAKDEANIAKHGISLARAADLDVLVRILDDRFEEDRRRAYGVIDGEAYCLAYTMRDGQVRAISLRRAHAKEMRRHVNRQGD